MKKGIIDFSEELLEEVLEGTSTSNIVDKLEKYLKPTTFEEACEPLMKWLSENQHPHTMAEVESNRAVLWEGKQTHLTEEFILD